MIRERIQLAWNANKVPASADEIVDALQSVGLVIIPTSVSEYTVSMKGESDGTLPREMRWYRSITLDGTEIRLGRETP